jgi:hypothetical protein
MFDGIMPPLASAVGAQAYASGVQTLPTSLTGALGIPTDGAAVGICQGEWKEARPRSVMLGFPLGGVQVGGAFPPHPRAAGSSASLDAGGCDVAGAALGGAVLRRLACQLEYGCGSSSQKVFFDWQPGTYNIPPCTFVRVSALPWGTDWNTVALLYGVGCFPVLATVSEGNLQDAHPPVVTVRWAAAAGTQYGMNAPACARAFEVANVDSSVTPVVRVLGDINARRDYATLTNYPGWTPLDVATADNIAVTSDVATTLQVIWTLAL